MNINNKNLISTFYSYDLQILFEEDFKIKCDKNHEFHLNLSDKFDLSSSKFDYKSNYKINNKTNLYQCKNCGLLAVGKKLDNYIPIKYEFYCLNENDLLKSCKERYAEMCIEDILQ
jgi:hypothetical protein